jgi:predicted MFS family arabinose efflux permease
VIAYGKSTGAEAQSPWGLIFILFGAGILSAFQVGKVPPVLSDMRADLGISLFDAGWLLSVFTFTGLLMGTFTGAIADAVGHRRLMLAGLVLQAAGSLLGSFALSYPGLLATRILEGTGFLAVIISTPTLIFQVVKPKDLKLALSIWTCYVPLGVSLMMVLLPVILMGTDWRGVWQINAAVLSAYTLLLSKKTAPIRFMNPSRGIRFKKILEDMVTTLKSPGPLVLSLIFVTYALQWLTVMGFLPTLINEKYGFSKSEASLLTAGMVFVNIFGNLAAGRLLEMGLARFKLIALAGVVMGTSAMVIYLDTHHFFINYSGCLIFSIFGGLIPACVLGAVPAYAPSKNRVATTNGLVVQFGQFGQVIGPPVLAFLVSQTGSWTTGSWFLGCVAGLGVVLSFFLSRIHPRQRGGDTIRN